MRQDELSRLLLLMLILLTIRSSDDPIVMQRSRGNGRQHATDKVRDLDRARDAHLGFGLAELVVAAVIIKAAPVVDILEPGGLPMRIGA